MGAKVPRELPAVIVPPVPPPPPPSGPGARAVQESISLKRDLYDALHGLMVGLAECAMPDACMVRLAGPVMAAEKALARAEGRAP